MSAGADSDESLMQRFAAGEAEAFELLYRRHEIRVWRYLRRSVASAATADDLMQEVWFAVAREAGRYRPVARFTTWLFTMAHNRLVDWLRTAHRELSLDTAIGDALAAELLVDGRAGPAEQAESAERARAMIAAVERLPDEQREAFVLQADGGLSVEEIATITGANFETTKSRLRYARTRLKQLLWEHA